MNPRRKTRNQGIAVQIDADSGSSVSPLICEDEGGHVKSALQFFDFLFFCEDFSLVSNLKDRVKPFLRLRSLRLCVRLSSPL